MTAVTPLEATAVVVTSLTIVQLVWALLALLAALCAAFWPTKETGE